MQHAGIYSIKNIVLKKIYIGQSSNVFNRLQGQRRNLEIGEHICKELQNDYDELDSKYFEFSVVEFCDVALLRSRESFNQKSINEDWALYGKFENSSSDFTSLGQIVLTEKIKNFNYSHSVSFNRLRIIQYIEDNQNLNLHQIISNMKKIGIAETMTRPSFTVWNQQINQKPKFGNFKPRPKS